MKIRIIRPYKDIFLGNRHTKINEILEVTPNKDIKNYKREYQHLLK